MTVINCAGKLLDLSSPVVMGILNITPDSFFDGGRYTTHISILQQAGKMIDEGAAIIDVGAASSRPGASFVSVEEEIQRIKPALKSLVNHFPETIFSIDSASPEAVRAAVGEGASIVNDISGGGVDDVMFKTVAALKTPYILMHIQGTPATMQKEPHYENATLEVLDYLIKRTGALRGLGVKDVIIDPGFGFGKNLAHNFELLSKLSVFQILDVPVLAGLSRKSMICQTLHISPSKALNGTTALNMLALQNGAKILRVHDVKEAVETVKLFSQYIFYNK